jgi:ubiquinone/menaquinone biosynthesis C-methylase UbiE
MLAKQLLHRIVAVPAIYDFCQRVAGAKVSRKVFLEEFSALPPKGRVLDVGGGTGLSRAFFPSTWEYSCLDPDPQKLEGFHSKFPHDESVEASACNIPLEDASFDLCIMVAVSHHLTDKELRASLSEIRRVLRPQGSFLLMDAVWNPANIRGRFLWSVDRGSFPKKKGDLNAAIAEHFTIERERAWRVHHEYVLLWCRKS